MSAMVSSRRTIWRPGTFRAQWLLRRASEIAKSAAIASLGRSFDVTSFSWMSRMVVKSRVAIVVSASHRHGDWGCARLRNFASFCNLLNAVLIYVCTFNTLASARMLVSERIIAYTAWNYNFVFLRCSVAVFFSVQRASWNRSASCTLIVLWS